jgi:hypothetical protein
MSKLSSVATAVLLSALTGCATIAGSPTHFMPISSTPSDAAIRITDEKGAEIFKGTTPTSVVLQKSGGGYFSKKSYTVEISKSGYTTQSIPVTANANGWYIGGNILFGGLIGWLIVDPMSGNMYNLSPETISANLGAAVSHNNTATNGGIAIMLLQDVPAELVGEMRRIN